MPSTGSIVDQLTLDAVELERRAGAGQVVRLLWVPDRNEVLVEQVDLVAVESTLRLVPSARAREAFDHPWIFPLEAPPYAVRVVAGEIEHLPV